MPLMFVYYMSIRIVGMWHCFAYTWTFNYSVFVFLLST